MIQKIQGQAPFQVLATNFSISPSEQDYVLQISASGKEDEYSDLFTVSAGVTKMVTNVANGSYYRMKNNASEVSINWRTQCNDGQGGGGGSYILPPATEQTLGGIKVGSGLTVQADGTLSSNGGADPEAIQEAIDANNTLIEEGEIIAGMAKQLYSPDGVTSEGAFAYRTTAGDEDVSTGPAKLQKVEGNASFPEVEYNDSVVLMRNGSEVEGFDADIEWGDITQWIAYTDTAQTEQILPIEARMKLNNGTNYPYFVVKEVGGAGSSEKAIQWTNNNGTLTASNGAAVTATTISANKWRFITNNNIEVNAEYDNEWLSIEITSTNAYVTRFDNGTNYQIKERKNIPNDIPYGESIYTYDGSDWSETLPQAITAMTINGVDYVPQSGDELVVTRTLSKTGNASYPAPSLFVALGLNSFDYNCNGLLTTMFDEECWYIYSSEGEGHYVRQEKEGYNAYAIRAVPSLDNGYVIHISDANINYKTAGIASSADVNEAEIDFSTTIIENNNMIVYPTAEKPYIIVSIGNFNLDKWCIHPRWSGYADEDFEDYTESVLDISSFNTDCPLLSVGNVRNIWDFENSQLIQNIGVSTYSAQAVQDLIDGGKEIGVDFDFDENNIYEVLDEPIVTDITFDNEYEANDFSVEYFVQDNDLISTPVYATTWYMNNLVDKLRRMNGIVHLDNLNGVGGENTLYECDEMLWVWSDSAGTVAEWTDNPATLGNTKGYGLIFSHIPEGQTLLEFKYPYSGNWRKIKMINGALTLTEADDTVVTSCTIGNKVQFSTTAYNFYWVKVNYKKHWIGFEVSSSVDLQNVWNGTVQGGHFVITDHSNHPWMDISSDYGIPRWNDKGQVIHKEIDIKNKQVKFNTTGYNGAYMLLSSGEGNLPNSMYVPTVGGTAGQILQSNGTEAAPSWTTMIKTVKITSAAYEALVQAGTTDPNTLYLIDDSNA